ncbi:hypothetical protein ACVI1L_005029 [Bradyrhizobium sp. USDA 4516]
MEKDLHDDLHGLRGDHFALRSRLIQKGFWRSPLQGSFGNCMMMSK